MGKDLKLTASDNFQLGAYRADTNAAPKGAVVVIQEIFGVNHHIRAVCDRLAGEGYVAIAPSIFDRVEPDFTSGYSPDEIAIARKFVAPEVALVSDDDIRNAQTALWANLRIVAEPGGAAALAALLGGAYRPGAGERIAVLVCGANTTAVNFDA